MKQYSLKGLQELIKSSDEYSTLASDETSYGLGLLMICLIKPY